MQKVERMRGFSGFIDGQWNSPFKLDIFKSNTIYY